MRLGPSFFTTRRLPQIPDDAMRLRLRLAAECAFT